jgi:hypothetical protein
LKGYFSVLIEKYLQYSLINIISLVEKVYRVSSFTPAVVEYLILGNKILKKLQAEVEVYQLPSNATGKTQPTLIIQT